MNEEREMKLASIRSALKEIKDEKDLKVRESASLNVFNEITDFIKNNRISLSDFLYANPVTIENDVIVKLLNNWNEEEVFGRTKDSYTKKEIGRHSTLIKYALKNNCLNNLLSLHGSRLNKGTPDEWSFTRVVERLTDQYGEQREDILKSISIYLLDLAEKNKTFPHELIASAILSQNHDFIEMTKSILSMDIKISFENGFIEVPLDTGMLGHTFVFHNVSIPSLPPSELADLWDTLLVNTWITHDKSSSAQMLGLKSKGEDSVGLKVAVLLLDMEKGNRAILNQKLEQIVFEEEVPNDRSKKATKRL